MSSILKRVEELERRMESAMNPPQPIRVFVGETDEEFQTFLTEHPGEKVVRIVTVCGRVCGPDCHSPGGPGCRKQMDEPARSWQPREGASCD